MRVLLLNTERKKKGKKQQMTLWDSSYTLWKTLGIYPHSTISLLWHCAR